MKTTTRFLFFVLILCLQGCTSKTEVYKTWTSFVQSVPVSSDSERKFKVVASVKVDTNDEKAKAGVWARVDTKTGGAGFFENMRNRPITSNTWDSYTIEGTIDNTSDRINIGGICYFNGNFYFDKFELYLENDEGTFELVTIQNPGFESAMKENKIPNWSLGTSKDQEVLVEGYSFNSSTDVVEGSTSLLIVGKDIVANEVTQEAIKEAFPNFGLYIGLIFLTILVLSILTYHTPTEDTPWSIWARIGFRFSFVYFLLIILFQNNGAYPFFDTIIEKPLAQFQQLVLWFGETVVQVPYRIAIGPNGSGDTTYDYLVIGTCFLLALLATLIWSVLDRKRTHYPKLYYALTTGVRYYVGLMLINYGLVKVIQLQFSSPTFYRLLQPYGDSSPMGLAWTFLGFSEGYNLFMGIAEVLAGLLLFRRTQTFGAIITLMTTMNVMAVNYFYDVPVKILSTHLVLMTLFLLARDLKRVLAFLLTNRAVEPLPLIQRPKFKKGVHIGLNVFKGLLIAYALGYGFYDTLDAKKLYGSDRPKPELYGVYEVTHLIVNQDTITDYTHERLWKSITLEYQGSARVDKRDESRIYYSVEVDTAAQKIKFSSSQDTFDWNYTKTDSTLHFNYILKNDTIYGETRRLGKKDFLLTSRGFNWINERPFNR